MSVATVFTDRCNHHGRNMSDDDSSPAPGTDHAGPLLGWSLKTGIQQQTLDELVDFPCVFTFKTVGVADDDLLDRIQQTVAGIVGRKLNDDEHSSRESAKGKYTSITLEVPVETSTQVYSLYAALGETPGVKFVL